MGKVENVLDEINKKFGKNSIMTLGDSPSVTEKLYSTGSLLIDRALGGGIGVGRVVELYGVESSGKSTLCLQIVAQAQKEGKKVAYIDAENALDPLYAKQLGVDINNLAFAQPTTAEEALEITDMLAKSGQYGLVIIDSVAAMVPQAELDGEMSDMTIGLMARLLSKALRKITNTLNSNDCTVIFINQLREKISTGWSGGGETTTTPGGRALKFFASQRIELKKVGQIKEGDTVVGNNTRIRVVKNKIGKPMCECTIPLMFGYGLGGSSEAIDIAIEAGLINQAGAWFTSHDGTRLQGKKSVREYYETNKDKYEDLVDKVKKVISGKSAFVEDLEIDAETGEVIEKEG